MRALFAMADKLRCAEMQENDEAVYAILAVLRLDTWVIGLVARKTERNMRRHD